MSRTLASAATMMFLLALALPASAQDLASQILGVWRHVSITSIETATGKVNQPFGENPVGKLIYTKTGHFTFFAVHKDKRAPGDAIADADRIEL